MSREKSIKVVTILTIATAAVAFFSVVINFLLPIYLANKINVNIMDIKEASSIGIIGGADGPTAIYIASQPSMHLVAITFTLLTMAGIMYLILAKRSVKKH